MSLTKLNLTIRDTRDPNTMSVLCMAGEPGTGKTHNAELLPELWGLAAGTEVKKLFFQMYDGAGIEKLLYDYNMPNILNALNAQNASAYTLTKLADFATDMIETHGATGSFWQAVNDPKAITAQIQKFKTENIDCVECNTGDSIQEGVLYQAARLSQTQKVVLILDEIDKARPEVDTFLLDFFQNGRLSDPLLGEVQANFENIIVVLTTNEQRELNDALYRRMRYWPLAYPNRQEEIARIESSYPTEVEALGMDKVKFLLDLSEWYRKQRVKRKIVTNQVGRLVRDLVLLAAGSNKLNSKQKMQANMEIRDAVATWFSPYKEDWVILEQYNVAGCGRGLDGIAKKLLQ